MRARNIKPSFFVNDVLAQVEPLGRLLFIGLWCMADRAGRLEDRPLKIKASILPFDECDVDLLLASLDLNGFIVRYSKNKERYIHVVNFTRHQFPHHKEKDSTIPSPGKAQGKTRERPDRAHLNPESPILNPESIGAPSGAFEIMDFFNSTCRKSLSLTSERKTLIEKRLAAGRTIDEMKTAISNFANDDWPDRHKYMDLVYVIGVRNKIDNLDKWLSAQKVEANGGIPEWMTRA